jgi:hypothetical protein
MKIVRMLYCYLELYRRDESVLYPR